MIDVMWDVHATTEAREKLLSRENIEVMRTIVRKNEDSIAKASQELSAYLTLIGEPIGDYFIVKMDDFSGEDAQFCMVPLSRRAIEREEARARAVR
jgi:hypothetical protein